MMCYETSLRTRLIFYIILGTCVILAASTAIIISTVTSHEEKLAYQQPVKTASINANLFDAGIFDFERKGISQAVSNFNNEEMHAGVTDVQSKLLLISTFSILFITALAYVMARSAAELKFSNKLKQELEIVINNSPVIIFLWKYEEGRPIEFTSNNITSLGYEIKDFKSNKIRYRDFVHPKDIEKLESELKRNVETGCADFSLEYRILTRSGEIRWVDERTVIQRNPSGEVNLQGIILDITEHRKAEDALLQMEEISKKEIHHRIKNNLQVISTLLYLESENFKDENVKEAFRDSQHRVKSMALIHDKLYLSEDMVSVDFAGYVQHLTDDILQSYSRSNVKVDLELDVEKVFLEMDTAVPLGIIINELVSNSFKHAFLEGENGKIRICLKKEENDKLNQGEPALNGYHETDIEKVDERKLDAGSQYEWFLLTVGDNGKGFPEGINFRETESLGLQLVTNLVDQINGRIKLDTITIGTDTVKRGTDTVKRGTDTVKRGTDTVKRGTEFKIWFRKSKLKSKI